MLQQQSPHMCVVTRQCACGHPKDLKTRHPFSAFMPHIIYSANFWHSLAPTGCTWAQFGLQCITPHDRVLYFLVWLSSSSSSFSFSSPASPIPDRGLCLRGGVSSCQQGRCLNPQSRLDNNLLCVHGLNTLYSRSYVPISYVVCYTLQTVLYSLNYTLDHITYIIHDVLCTLNCML